VVAVPTGLISVVGSNNGIQIAALRAGLITKRPPTLCRQIRWNGYIFVASLAYYNKPVCLDTSQPYVHLCCKSQSIGGALGLQEFSLKTAPLEGAVGSDDADADDADADGDEPMDPQPKSNVTGQETKRKRKRSDSPGVPAVHDAHELDEDIATPKIAAPFFRISLKPFYHRNI
jgi:hypothetical protein